MIYLYILLAMAQSLMVVMKSNAEADVVKSIENMSNVTLGYDDKMEEKTYVVENNGVKTSVSNALELKSLLSGLSIIDEMPEDMETIITSLKGKKIDLVEELKSGAYTFIVFFSDSGDDLKNMQELERNSAIKYFFSSDRELAKRLGVSFPGVLGYNSEENNVVRLPIDNDIASIIAAVTMKSFTKLSAISYQKLQQISQPIYYIIDGNHTFEEMSAEIGEMCKEFSSYCKFLFFRPNEISALVDLLECKDEEYPLMVYISQEKKNVIRGLSKDNFTESVMKMLNGKVENVKFSSRLPEDNETRGLKVLNTDTIDEFINNEGIDRMVVFTTTSCKYCIMLQLEMEQLGSELRKRGTQIVLGSYNCIENGKVPGIIIEKVPTILFYRKGSKEPLTVDENIRTAVALIEFIEKNSSVAVKASDFPNLTEAKSEQNYKEEILENTEKEAL